MEEVKRGSLKTQFFAAVAATLAVIVLASAATVWGCWAVRRRILPEPNKVALIIQETSADGKEHQRNQIEFTLDGSAEPVIWMSKEMTKPDTIDDPNLLVGEADFSVERIEASVSQLDLGERAAYTAVGVLMGVLPTAYALAGTVLCALWFYRKRLAPAITVLDDATRHISGQDLDFTVACPVHNELGRLCGSFEEMRRALYDNNLKLWRSMEERRTMQASVAHDLRNPLAILEGTVEHIRALAAAGELTGERLEAALETVSVTAKRLERYADYMRDLSALEDTEIHSDEVTVPAFLQKAAESVRVLAEPKGLTVSVSCDVPEGVIELDKEIFYRVLENVFSNAVRYARSRVGLAFALRGETLLARITDDGPGFSAEMLKKKSSLYYSEDASGEHMGLGLATGKILCGLHGGGLKIMNAPEGGAVVEITVAIKRI